MDQDTNTPAPNEFYLGMDDYPSGDGIYFRAIASASGYVDSISAMNGPYTFIYDPAADVSLTIPGVSGTPGRISIRPSSRRRVRSTSARTPIADARSKACR